MHLNSLKLDRIIYLAEIILPEKYIGLHALYRERTFIPGKSRYYIIVPKYSCDLISKPSSQDAYWIKSKYSPLSINYPEKMYIPGISRRHFNIYHGIAFLNNLLNSLYHCDILYAQRSLEEVEKISSIKNINLIEDNLNGRGTVTLLELEGTTKRDAIIEFKDFIRNSIPINYDDFFRIHFYEV